MIFTDDDLSINDVMFRWLLEHLQHHLLISCSIWMSTYLTHCVLLWIKYVIAIYVRDMIELKWQLKGAMWETLRFQCRTE